MHTLFHLFDHTNPIYCLLIGVFVGLLLTVIFAKTFMLYDNLRCKFPKASTWAALLFCVIGACVVSALSGPAFMQAYQQAFAK